MMLADDITLNILIEGHDPVHGAFPITISRTEAFDDLADRIQSHHLQKTGSPIFCLMLFSCNLPRDQLQNFRASDENALAHTDEVSSAWPVVPSNHGQLIHVFVKCQIGSLPKLVSRSSYVSPFDGLLQPTKSSNRLIKSLATQSIAQATEIKYFRQQLVARETHDYIRSGSCYERTGPSIFLYHPVFGQFVSNLRSTSPIPPDVLSRVQECFPASQAIHNTEYHDPPNQSGERETVIAARDQNSRGQLSKLLESFLPRSPAVGTRPDDFAIDRDRGRVLLIEAKDETETRGNHPSNQAARYYGRVWSNAGARQLLLKCCCPSIIIAISGLSMTVLGAVFLDRPVVKLLTTAFCVRDETAHSLKLSHLARVLDTLSKAQITLEEFYGNIQAPIRNPGRFFPYITHYKDSDGKQIEFTYLKALSEDYPDADKLVFLAGTGPIDQQQHIVIKFVRRYNAKAHTLLAERQLAPKLLYDGTVHPQNQPGPDHAMIVMEFLHGVDLGKFTDYPLPESVHGDIDNALKCLHDENFVFGDLRDPNVMIETNKNGTVVGAKLIDFDWCGVHQEGRYPDSMNPYINWTEGAEPGALMDKRHDTGMRKKLNLWM